jgi:hypothetical protein
MQYSVEIKKLNRVIKGYDKLVSRLDVSKLSPAAKKEFKVAEKKMKEIIAQRDMMQETLNTMKSFGANDIKFK